VHSLKLADKNQRLVAVSLAFDEAPNVAAEAVEQILRLANLNPTFGRVVLHHPHSGGHDWMFEFKQPIPEPLQPSFDAIVETVADQHNFQMVWGPTLDASEVAALALERVDKQGGPPAVAFPPADSPTQ
jgi:hypothetical protein